MANVQDRRTFTVGSTIFRQGMGGSEAFIIQSGIVEIIREANGREEVLEICEKGALIGVNAIAEDDQPRQNSARALTPVLAVVISRRQVAQRARLVPELPGEVGDDVEIELRRMDPLKARIVGIAQGHTRICFEIDSREKQLLSSYVNDLMDGQPPAPPERLMDAEQAWAKQA